MSQKCAGCGQSVEKKYVIAFRQYGVNGANEYFCCGECFDAIEESASNCSLVEFGESEQKDDPARLEPLSSKHRFGFFNVEGVKLRLGGTLGDPSNPGPDFDD